MSHLERAISIAVEAHKGQKDKAGQPYILHPLRIMFSMNTESEKIAAVLHDLVEDCEGWNFDRLQAEGFNSEVIEAVKLLTRDPKTGYDEYIEKIKENRIALKVKLADLEDNMDIRRISSPGQRDFERIKRYTKTYNKLREYFYGQEHN